MNNLAYNFGYGFGLAFDSFPWGTAVIVDNPGDKDHGRKGWAQGRAGSDTTVVVFRDGPPNGRVMPDSSLKSLKGDTALGANAISHPAKHEVARAEIAGKTGTTGGPATKKPSGEGRVREGRMQMPEGITWPSNDAIKGSEYLGRSVVAKNSELRRRQQLRWEYKNTPTTLSEEERKEVETNFREAKERFGY